MPARQSEFSVEFTRLDHCKLIIFTAVQLETRAVQRALAGLNCIIHTIGIRACRLPAELPADTAVVIVAGLAGALEPGLKVGDVVIDDPAGIVPATIGFRRALIHTADRIVATPLEKASLYQRMQCLAVDMETALVRARFGIPVVNVRAISDTADEVLDPRVVGLVDEVGRAKPIAIARMLLGRPTLVPYLNRLGKNSKLAARELGRATRAIVLCLNRAPAPDS